MLNTTALTLFLNRTGIFSCKRRNKSKLYQRLYTQNDADDHHDIVYTERLRGVTNEVS